METENRFFYLQKYFNKEYIYYLNKINKVRNLVYVSFSVSKSKKKNQKNRLVDAMIGTMASKVRFLSVFHFLCINMTWQCEKIESLPHHKHSSSSTFTHWIQRPTHSVFETVLEILQCLLKVFILTWSTSKNEFINFWYKMKNVSNCQRLKFVEIYFVDAFFPAPEIVGNLWWYI